MYIIGILTALFKVVQVFGSGAVGKRNKWLVVNGLTSPLLVLHEAGPWSAMRTFGWYKPTGCFPVICGRKQIPQVYSSVQFSSLQLCLGEKEERHTKERGIEPAAQAPNEAKHLLFSRSDTYGANNKDYVKECLKLCCKVNQTEKDCSTEIDQILFSSWDETRCVLWCTAASASGDYFLTPTGVNQSWKVLDWDARSKCVQKMAWASNKH